MLKESLTTINQLDGGMVKKIPQPLVRRATGLMALEQRFMFDGAAVETALAMTESADSGAAQLTRQTLFNTQALTVTVPANLTTAQSDAERLLTEFLARDDANSQLYSFMHGNQDGLQASAQWLEAFDRIQSQLNAGEISLRVELASAAELEGAKGAFSMNGTTGVATIYLNLDWLKAGADAASVTAVLLEEVGHYLDAQLNAGADSPGDEGEAFSSLLTNGRIDWAALNQQGSDASGTIQVHGQQVEVEFANYTFVNAYAMVYDLNNNGLTVGSTGESAAEKEQSTHNFNPAGLGQARIDDGYDSSQFSGNDVSASTVVIGGTTLYGWISRPIKSGGVVRGFYFWTDPQFTRLSLAQTDGNQDGDANATDNRGYLLVIDQDWFTDQITSNSFTVTTAIDGTALRSYARVGSSSDRVDSALNSLSVPNSAPTPANDSLTMSEDSGASTVNAANGLLANDTDVNNNSLTVTAFSVGGVSTSVNTTTGGAYAITGVGTITIFKDGSYSFTPVANYYGSVPPVTYTVSDGDAFASAVLSITVTPVNDAPTATNDALTTAEGTTVLLGLSDFGTFSDVDGDSLVKVQITTLESNGSLEYFNGSIWVPVTLNQEVTVAAISSGKLRFVPDLEENGSPYTTVGFKVSDGTAYSASVYTLTINVTAGNTAPVANADTAPDAIEAGGTANDTAGTNPAGNVLSNDTDADGAITPGTTHKVTQVSSAAANTSSAVTTGTTSVSSPASIAGLYGTLKIGANGSYIYEVDNSNTAVQALLSSANTLSEVFTYTMADGAGAGTASTSTLTVVIKGANDAPLAVDDYDSLQETALISGNYGTTTGNVLPNDTDVDAGDTKTVVLDGTTPSGSSDVVFSASSPISAVTLSVTKDLGDSWTATVTTSSSAQYAVWLNASGTSVALDRSGGTLTVYRSGSGTGATLVFSDNVALYDYQNTNLYIFNGSNKTAIVQVSVQSATTSSSNIVSTSSTSISNIAVGYEVSGTGVTAGTTVTAIDLASKQITLSTAANIANTSLTFHNPNGISLTASQAYKAGTYGHLIVEQSGAYTYTLTSNALTSGQTYTENFDYTAKDGQNLTSAAVLHIVISGNTAITLDDESASTNEGVTLTVADGGANDLMDGDSGVTTISTFSWGGTTANAGQTITIANVGALTINANGSFSFDPVDHYTGSVPTAIYTVAEGGSASLSLTISATNDDPTASNDAVTTLEDTPIILGLTDFGVFSDLDGNALTKVQIVSRNNTAGVLEFNNGGTWQTVTDGQEITVADISSGKVRFVPDANESGSAYTVISFKVHDGTTYSGSAYTLTVNVTPVNDAPVHTVPSAQTLFDYQTLTFGAGLSVNDVDSTTDITSVGLTVSHGQLSASAAGGGAASGAGTASSPLMLTGTKAQLDAMLAIMVYQPDTGFSGTDALRMVTTDAGGLSDTDYVDITVSPDNRALTIAGTTVNEASPYVLFTVTGAAGQKVFLSLNSGTATLGADFFPNLEYFDGTSWAAYTGSAVSIPLSGTTLLVRSAVLQDSLNEVSENLTLTATNKAGAAATGVNTSYITDNGTGAIYLETNLTGTANFSTDDGSPSYLDDDRPISVNSIVVNEASPRAVFTVSVQSGQVVRLALSSMSATVGTDTGSGLQYNNGSGWQTYATNTDITVAGTTLLVRTTLTQDAIYEGQEAVALGVTKQSSGATVYGTASIYDDGTGDVFVGSNTTGTPDIAGATDYPTTLDDDRPTLTIADVSVEEGSKAVFDVSLSKATEAAVEIAFTVTLGTAEAGDMDTANLVVTYVDGSSVTQTLTAVSGKYTVPAGITALRVTVATINDAIYEGGETFTLSADVTDVAITDTDTGLGTVKDDGSSADGDDAATDIDDDRPALTVAGVDDVSEGSYAIFTVTLNKALEAATTISLTLADGTAVSSDYTGATMNVVTSLSTAVASGTTVNNAGNYTLAAGVQTFYVRVQTTADSPKVLEGAESFTLTAAFTQAALKFVDRTGTVTTLRTGASADDTSTILDNGAGKVYDGLGGDTGTPDDDRATGIVSTIGITVTGKDDVSEGGNAIFAVALDSASASATEITLTLGAAGDTAVAADYSTMTAYYFVSEVKTTLTMTGGNISLPAGVTSFFVRVATTDDSPKVLEGSESFTLTASISLGASASDTATILDDGSGRVYSDQGMATLDTPDDDRPKPQAPEVPAKPQFVVESPVLPAPPEPARLSPPPFDSAIAARPTVVPVLGATPTIGDALTSNSGFRVVVNESAPAGLTLYKGVTDQFIDGEGSSKISLPADAFIHSKQDAVIKLDAKMADDAKLPAWVRFDPATGSFEVQAPANFKGKLEVKVIARDEDGREATSIFRIFVGEEPATSKPQGRLSLTEKIRLASKRPVPMTDSIQMDRLVKPREIAQRRA